MASVLEQLMSVLSPEEQTIVRAKLDPKLVAQDKKNDELFGYWTGIENGTAITEPASTTTTTETHVAALPSSAATTVAPVVTAPSTSSVDSAAILASLNGLKASIDERFKNVVTMDKVNELGANLLNEATSRALRQADEISLIRETNRKEFGKELDRTAFEKFVTDNQDPTTKRNKYATLTDAYDAMVAQERVTAQIAKGVAEGVKQVTSAATVPGQSTSTALSPAQQVMAKSRAAASNGDGKTGVQAAIDRLAALERSREASTVQ